MKVISILCVSFILVASVLAESSIEDVRNSAAELCKKELNAGDDVAAILKLKQLPSNEAESCFIECVYGKLQLIKNGQLNEEGAKALAKQKFGEDKEKLAKTDEVFKKCQQEVQSATQEKCYLGKSLRKCLITYSDQCVSGLRFFLRDFKIFNMKFLTGVTILLCAAFIVKAEQAKPSAAPSTTPKSVATTIDAKNNKTGNLTFPKNLKANDSLHNRFNAVATECKKELNANQGTPEIMALLSSGALPTNEKQRCFLECVYNKVGLIKDGKVNEEGAMSLAKAKFGENKDLMTKAEALFKKCKTEAVVEKDSKEKCALGRLIRTCIVNHGNNLPIFSKAS
ncbi:uncharacterized protein LOC135840594 [Planococcus citri]|uniref:uncharacterized protein LOC135840594 n=1 Tax=Planococcus citri TaxID=170843 RepID=UPI0031FA2DE0